MNKPPYTYFEEERNDAFSRSAVIIWLLCGILTMFIAGIFFFGCTNPAYAAEYTDNQIANAIYHAEGGANTRHPYGILAHYKHTTPRQACINTIRHAKRDWNGRGDFIVFLGNRYCPVGAANDPTGLNKNWIRNVKYFLERGN